jgi:hypothetical protein
LLPRSAGHFAFKRVLWQQHFPSSASGRELSFSGYTALSQTVDKTYIVLERIHGEIIGVGLVKHSADSKTKILSHFRNMVEKMRRIKQELVSLIGIINWETFECFCALGVYQCLERRPAK